MRYQNWLGRIADHRAGNGLPPITAEEAEHQNCAGLSLESRLEFCKDADPNAVQTIGLHLWDIVRGSLTLAGWKANGSQVVPIEEAERRAGICSTCPYNVAYRSGCGVDCQQLTDAVVSLVGQAATSLDGRLNACAICKCSLRAKVHIPLDDIRRFESAELQSKYPEWCWLALSPEPA
jgi:hypothetical protein